MHRPGLAPQASPRRAPALSPARPPAAERRGRPARPRRRPWLRWWSTRASRPATTAATANPRRARCPAVSVPVHGARRGRLASPPRTARRAPANPSQGSPQARLPFFPLPFPTRFFADRFLSHRVSSSPKMEFPLPRRNGNSGKLPWAKMARAASAPRGCGEARPAGARAASRAPPGGAVHCGVAAAAAPGWAASR